MTDAAFVLSSTAPPPRPQSPPSADIGAAPSETNNDFSAHVAASRDAHDKKQVRARPGHSHESGTKDSKAANRTAKTKDSKDAKSAKDAEKAGDAKAASDAKESKSVKDAKGDTSATKSEKSETKPSKEPGTDGVSIATADKTAAPKKEQQGTKINADVSVKEETAPDSNALSKDGEAKQTKDQRNEQHDKAASEPKPGDASKQVAELTALAKPKEASAEDLANKKETGGETTDAGSASDTAAPQTSADTKSAPQSGEAGALINRFATEAAAASAQATPDSTATSAKPEQNEPASKPVSNHKPAPDADPASANLKAKNDQAVPTTAHAGTEPAGTAKQSSEFVQTLQTSGAQDAKASPPTTGAPSSTPAQAPVTSPALAPALTTGQMTDAATIRAEMNGPRLTVPAEAIAFEMHRHQAEGIDQFKIRLDPPELGRIDVKLELGSDGTTKAHLTADRQDTLDLLQRDSRALERALSGVGLKADRDTLNFSLRQDGAPGGQPGHENAGTGASSGSIEAAQEIVPAPIQVRITDPTRIDILI